MSVPGCVFLHNEGYPKQMSGPGCAYFPIIRVTLRKCLLLGVWYFRIKVTLSKCLLQAVCAYIQVWSYAELKRYIVRGKELRMLGLITASHTTIKINDRNNAATRLGANYTTKPRN